MFVPCKASSFINEPALADFPLQIFHRTKSESKCCVVSYNRNRIKFNSSRIYVSKGNNNCNNGNGNGKIRVEKGGNEVRCEVEVVSWRERRIRAEISVNADVDSVWNALTDYERLADFIPNLVCSERIPCPHPGRIWLEQRGLQRALYWHIEARVVLDLQEFLHSANDRELYFSMVDGDFKKFEGKWSIKSGTRSTTAMLKYEVNVIPRFNFPAIFLERIIRSDLPVNLQALAYRAERSFEGNRKTLLLNNSLGKISLPVFTSPVIDVDGSLHEKASGKYITNSNFGSMHPCQSDLSSNWGIFGKVCRLDKPCVVDEVHLRRFDGLLENGGVHRCVVASITVKAPAREVWNVLTAYESLPEFVPNLAISKILMRENNKVRILQVELCEHQGKGNKVNRSTRRIAMNNFKKGLLPME